VNRRELEHVINAAADITGDEIVVIGSQAILGPFPTAPAALLRSMEADLYPRNDPDRAIEIDGAIGDGSQFHKTFGYYAHGVGPETPWAPVGWEGRMPSSRFHPCYRVANRSQPGSSRHTTSPWPSSRPAARRTSNSSPRR